MADTSLRGRLRRLFSTNVVVRRIAQNRLKVVDTNKIQSSGAVSNTSYIDRFSGLHRGQGGYGGYNQTMNFHQSKLELFTDYEAMDMDPILASALDIYADEATVKNTDGDTLTIQSPNAEIQKVLRNLFYDIINIDYNLWPWIRNACKYGDFFLHLDIEEQIGIVNVIPMSAYEIRREEGYDTENPYAYRFVLEGSHMSYASGQHQKMDTFENYEVAHFRLLSDTNFLPYGKAMIEPARKIYKQLSLMEDAMLIQRIMRAPERRIFKIDVGNIPPAEVDNHMQTIIGKMKKIPYMDEKTGEYNLKFNMENMMEDYYLPVRGSESGTSIESLPGLSNDGQIEDIDYLRNKMMAALKIPKAFLGYDEGVEGKATLAAEDVRFARTIERIQKIFLSELTKIAIVHLYSQGYTDEDLVDFELNLASPSTMYEQEKIELFGQKVSLARDMIQDKILPYQWIYDNIFNFSKDEQVAIQKQIIEDQKEKFRHSQIEMEGNDPQDSGEAVGTPSDMAQIGTQSAEEGQPEEESPMGSLFDFDEGGRPKEMNHYGKDSGARGRDPLGKQTKNRRPLALAHFDALKKTMGKKSKTILKETNQVDEMNKEYDEYKEEKGKD